MKIKKFLTFLLIIFSANLAFAQTQKGYIKTRGRMGSNGVVIPGTRIEGATIGINGGNSVVSGENGNFVLSVPTGKFSLSAVKKSGYELADPDALKKQYQVSSNDFIIILQEPEQQKQDKLMAERKIRRTLEKQLQQKEDEIVRLQEENKITQEQFNAALEKLYAEYDEDQRLVSSMAQKYSDIDYDAIDEFNIEISRLILEGELSKADSMLNSRGSIDTEIEEYFKISESNKREGEELAKREENLAKSQLMAEKQKEDLALRCYNKYQIFAMQHEIDSAAYYIGRRADIDPENMEWQYSAILYNNIFFADYGDVLRFYERIVNEYPKREDATEDGLIVIYSRLADEYEKKGMKEKAHEFKMKSLNGRINMLEKAEKDSPDDLVSILYANFSIASEYQSMNDEENAMKYMLKVGELWEKLDGESLNLNLGQAAQVYLPLGVYYLEQENHDKAIKYLEEFYKYVKDEQSNAWKFYKNLVERMLLMSYIALEKTDKWQPLLEDYLDSSLNMYGKDSPTIGQEYLMLGAAFEESKDYYKSLEFYQKGYDILKKYADRNEPEMLELRNSIKEVKEIIKKQEKENK